jgi:hypothetical protein
MIRPLDAAIHPWTLLIRDQLFTFQQKRKDPAHARQLPRKVVPWLLRPALQQRTKFPDLGWRVNHQSPMTTPTKTRQLIHSKNDIPLELWLVNSHSAKASPPTVAVPPEIYTSWFPCRLVKAV